MCSMSRKLDPKKKAQFSAKRTTRYLLYLSAELKLPHTRTIEAGATATGAHTGDEEAAETVALLHVLPLARLRELAAGCYEQPAHHGHPVPAKYRAAAPAPASLCSALRAHELAAGCREQPAHHGHPRAR